MKLHEACAYIIVDEDKLLAADRGRELSAPVIEGKPWVAVKRWLNIAKAAGERVPFVVWDAKSVHRWLGWGLLVDLKIRDIDEDHRETTFCFQNLRPLGDCRRDELHLLKQQRMLSKDFIRSYARLKTPDFIREAARHDGPLLSEWLSTADAVAHAFRLVYDDENERREAETILGRIVRVAEEGAHGSWGVLLTPGRIRMIVGKTLIAQMGYDPPNLVFWPDPESQEEEDDPDMSLTDIYAKYERRFRVHIKNLAMEHRGERTPSQVVEEYLASQGHQVKSGDARFCQTELVREYLQARGCLDAE